MAITEGNLSLAFDENTGKLAELIRIARMDAFQSTHTLDELGLATGADDREILARLGALGVTGLITRDGRMLDPPAQRAVWREAGVTLFLLSKNWGRMPLGEMSRRFLFVWPNLLQHAKAGQQGIAWRISPSVPAIPSTSFRLVTVPGT